MPETTPETPPEEFNVLNHNQVPLHEVLEEAETRALYEHLNIAPEQLPKIMLSDPAARAAAAKPGQVLRIMRNSETAGEAVAYRLVIEYQV